MTSKEIPEEEEEEDYAPSPSRRIRRHDTASDMGSRIGSGMRSGMASGMGSQMGSSFFTNMPGSGQFMPGSGQFMPGSGQFGGQMGSQMGSNQMGSQMSPGMSPGQISQMVPVPQKPQSRSGSRTPPMIMSSAGPPVDKSTMIENQKRKLQRDRELREDSSPPSREKQRLERQEKIRRDQERADRHVPMPRRAFGQNKTSDDSSSGMYFKLMFRI
jgi:hypothetical protein